MSEMATLSCDDTTVVFIDTNLDTHLALIVSDHDTVSDLKKRILSEHPSCFPKMGDIQIHGIKVKRRGHFYNLSDSMFVRNAFSGFNNKSWFLSVDASQLGECSQSKQLVSHGSPNQLSCHGIANDALVGPGDNAVTSASKRVSGLDNFQPHQLEYKHDEGKEIHNVSQCVPEQTDRGAVKSLETVVISSGNNDNGIQDSGLIRGTEDRSFANHEVPSLHIEREVDGSGKGIRDICNVREEDLSISVPNAKTNRKGKRKREDAVLGDNSKDNNASVDNTLSRPSKRTSGMNNLQVPLMENNLDVNEEIPVVGKVVKKLEMDVKSSGNNDPGIPFTSSLPEVRDNCCLNHELPNSHFDGVIDGSNEGIKGDYIVPEEGTCKAAPATKKRQKSKRKKEETVQGDNSKDNIASIGNPLSSPSNLKNSQAPQSENKQVENNDIAFVEPSILAHSGKEVVKNSEVEVKSSINNDPDIPFTKSLLEPQDYSGVNHELPNSHIEGIEDANIVSEEGTSKPVPAAQKKQKSKRKKEYTMQDGTSKENDASVVGPVDYAVHQDIVVLANPSDNADKEVIKETEVLKEHQHTELNNNNTKNDLDAVLMEEVSEPRSAADKKHRKRRSSTHDSKEMLKVETAPQNDEAHEERKESMDEFELNNDKSRDDVEHSYNKLTEDILDTTPSAKKKQKGQKKRGDQSLSNTKLVSGFNVDQSAEQFKGADPLRTFEQGRRRKGKINLSNLDETPVVTSSRNDGEADHSIIKRGAHEEISEDCLLSKDISTAKTTLDNMEIRTDACKEGTQNDPNFEAREPGTNITELNVSSEVVNVSGMNEPVKSEKKKRGTKKAKNLGGELAHPEGIDLVVASKSETDVKSLKASNCDLMSRNSETKENPLNQPEGGKTRQEDMQGTVLFPTGKEDDLSMDNAASLELNKTKSKPEHLDGRVEKSQRKKSNNKQTCTSKSISNLPTQDQFLDSQKECDVPRIDPDKKVRKLRKIGQDAKLSSRSDSPMFSIGENRKPLKNGSGKSVDLEKGRDHLPISNSKLESSKKIVKKKAGKALVSDAQQRKSLLAGAIFNDDSSCTSEDEVDNSDVSTRTPSHNSLLSDFSDGDNSADLDSQLGAYDGKRMENGGNSSKASLSGTKGMSIDVLLKSSSRYKKAKITASQLDETETQPEYVPDSLADI